MISPSSEVRFSNGCSSLQILLDFGRILSVESFQFLVEAHIALVDVVDVLFFVKRTTTAVLVSFLHSVEQDIHNMTVVLRIIIIIKFESAAQLL